MQESLFLAADHLVCGGILFISPLPALPAHKSDVSTGVMNGASLWLENDVAIPSHSRRLRATDLPVMQTQLWSEGF